METVRWGLLSTANINRRLIPAIRASERGELVAVASRSEASAQAYAAEWGIPQAFGSYEAMLASDAVDAVYIGLPNQLHAPWSIAAMEAGKHVLCEKPFALSLEEVDRVTAVAQTTNMRIAEAFMYRHHPQTKIAGELLRSGRIGDITVLRGVFNFKLANPENVRLDAALGGGSLWDVGCYPMSIAQFFMGGPPESVFGEQWTGEADVDVLFNGQMRWANGRVAQISSSFLTPRHTFVEVLGTAGRLTLDHPFIGHNEGDPQLLVYDAEDRVERIAVPEKMLYLGEVEDMHAAILDGAPNYLTLAETRNHIKTLLALYESARSGRPVTLS